MTDSGKRWYSGLTGYHWFVLAVCTLGWLFDCMDQQLFALARNPAVAELLGISETAPRVAEYAGYATSILLIGWATGGIIFGILGDKIGRARTMIFTILFYSVFTGMCGVAVTLWDFILYRFLTGLGVGAQFAIGAALVAETMPDHARTRALGLLQALSAFGNISAALIQFGVGYLVENGMLPFSAWRWMFAIGVVPALLSVVVMRYLREPERWKAAVSGEEKAKHKAGSLVELFGDPRWRYRVIIGMLLASAGVIGLWGIGFFSIDLNRMVFRKIAEQRARDENLAEIDRRFVQLVVRSPGVIGRIAQSEDAIAPRALLSLDAANKDPQSLYQAALWLHEEGRTVSPESVLAALDSPGEGWLAQSPDDRQRRAEYLAGDLPDESTLPALTAQITARRMQLDGETGRWGGRTSLLFNIGAFFGIYAFALVTDRIGRRWAFMLAFLAALLSTTAAFLFMDTGAEVLWMVPLMGFSQLAVFGGYAIYFPELFPTRLRSTATSFCYNIGRYVAAAGPSALGLLTSEVFTQERGFAEPMRYAGATMCSIFLLGIVVAWFAPETKGQPLPE